MWTCKTKNQRIPELAEKRQIEVGKRNMKERQMDKRREREPQSCSGSIKPGVSPSYLTLQGIIISVGHLRQMVKFMLIPLRPPKLTPTVNTMAAGQKEV